MANRGKERAQSLPEVCVIESCFLLHYRANGVSMGCINLVSDFQGPPVFKAQSTLHRMGGKHNSVVLPFSFIVAVRKLQCHDFCIR